MSKWIEGTVVGQKRWTERLYSLQVEAPMGRFEAGQFAKLALAVDGQMVARPYSFVNAPDERPLEFYYVVLPEGPLTTQLVELEPQDTIYLAPNPSGFLVLSEVPSAENLWLISTGTGIGPFLSMLKTAVPWSRFKDIVLVHAVRHAIELTYRDTINALQARYPEQLHFVSLVSRESHPGSLAGRIPAAIADGRLEQAAGARISAESSQIMLCGNPDMVASVTEQLKARGMKKNRRRDPGQITVENYW